MWPLSPTVPCTEVYYIYRMTWSDQRFLMRKEEKEKIAIVQAMKTRPESKNTSRRLQGNNLNMQGPISTLATSNLIKGLLRVQTFLKEDVAIGPTNPEAGQPTRISCRGSGLSPSV